MAVNKFAVYVIGLDDQVYGAYLGRYGLITAGKVKAISLATFGSSLQAIGLNDQVYELHKGNFALVAPEQVKKLISLPYQILVLGLDNQLYIHLFLSYQKFGKGFVSLETVSVISGIFSDRLKVPLGNGFLFVPHYSETKFSPPLIQFEF